MNRTILLELYEEHTKVNIYTFKYIDEDITEFDKFLDLFDTDEFKEDIDILLYWIEKIGKEGANDRYFRPEKGSMVALPPPLETSNLRLFCFKLTDGIVILGNGGVKNTRTYNEDPILNSHAENILSIGKIISSQISNGGVYEYNNTLYQLKQIKFIAI